MALGRMQLVAAATMALTACGRIQFASQPDAPPADTADAAALHDEDGDGLPDVSDPCPYIAGDATDSDGDGVGDACDPNPSTPTEHFLLFATMQPGDPGFDDITGWDQLPDAIHITSISSQLFVTRTVDTVRIDLGFDVNGAAGAGQHQIANGVVGAGEYYFAELNDNVPMQDLGIISYDATNGYVTVAQTTAGALQVGPGSLRTDAIDGTAPAFVIAGGWNGAELTTNAPTPGYLGGTGIRFGFNGLDVTIRYLAIIVTQ